MQNKQLHSGKLDTNLIIDPSKFKVVPDNYEELLPDYLKERLSKSKNTKSAEEK